jgi:hypothetical protein
LTFETNGSIYGYVLNIKFYNDNNLTTSHVYSKKYNYIAGINHASLTLDQTDNFVNYVGDPNKIAITFESTVDGVNTKVFETP